MSNCHQQIYSKRIAKGSSLNKKETIKERTLKYERLRKNRLG
jgi:hypothetical protein